MKFKREDIGLYFALGLVGGGVGLLVGAFIASRREGTMPRYISEDDWDDGPMVYDEGKTSEEMTRKFPPKKKRVKKGQRADSQELKRFIREFDPSAIQIEMVRSGLLTIDELQDTMIQEEIAKTKEPYNYTGPYLLDEDKPDLADLATLPEDEEPIDDRYQILQKPPKRKSPKNMRVVYFDQEDGSFYTMTRQKQPVPLGSINEFISEETWEVMLPYMLSGFTPLFINDLQTAKYYRFELVPEDEEDPLGHNDGTYE